MFALIRKDVIASRLILVISLAVYFLYALTAYDTLLGLFILNVVATIVLTLIPIIIDEKYRIDTLVCFLPPARHEVVLARYVTALLALLVGLGLHYGVGSLVSAWFGGGDFSTLCVPQAVFLFCSVPLLFVAFFLPCCFRLGLGWGAFAFIAVTVALTIGLAGPLLALDVFSVERGFVVTRDMLERPELVLVATVDHLATLLGGPWFYVVTSVILVSLMVASMAVSIRFFRRRDF